MRCDFRNLPNAKCRFKGMSALFASSSVEAEASARSLGMGIVPHLKPIRVAVDQQLPSPELFSESIATSLGQCSFKHSTA